MASKIMEKISQSDFTIYHNHRAEPYFTFVKNGQKTIEGRIKRGWYRFVKPRDHIIIYNEDESDLVEVLVRDVRTYSSIQDMLKHEQLKKILPDVETIEQGIEVYKRFYTNEQQQKFGVIAIAVGRIEK